MLFIWHGMRMLRVKRIGIIECTTLVKRNDQMQWYVRGIVVATQQNPKLQVYPARPRTAECLY